MEAQLYNHYSDGDGCSIAIGLSNKDIKEIIKIRDTIMTSMSMPYWNNLLKLLNLIIAETKKDDTKGLRYRDAQLKERL
jgi:hypothetical protein